MARISQEETAVIHTKAENTMQWLLAETQKVGDKKGPHTAFREGMEQFEHYSSILSPLPASETCFAMSLNLITSTQQVIVGNTCMNKFIYTCDMNFEKIDLIWRKGKKRKEKGGML